MKNRIEMLIALRKGNKLEPKSDLKQATHLKSKLEFKGKSLLLVYSVKKIIIFQNLRSFIT